MGILKRIEVWLIGVFGGHRKSSAGVADIAAAQAAAPPPPAAVQALEMQLAAAQATGNNALVTSLQATLAGLKAQSAVHGDGDEIVACPGPGCEKDE